MATAAPIRPNSGIRIQLKAKLLAAAMMFTSDSADGFPISDSVLPRQVLLLLIVMEQARITSGTIAANKTRKAYELGEVLMASNPYEKTHFKSGFCGVKPAVLQKGDKGELEQLPLSGVFRMAGHYLGQYATNPGYINSSLLDTAGATASYYMIPHHYFRLYSYIPWDEKVIDETLISQYDWETSPDTKSTWRIGDGTAPFYNYIYYLVAGFSENDTLRSNQIREGMLTREEAITLIERDNRPRFDSMQWYFDAIGLDMAEALKIIAKIPRLYEK